MFTTDLWYIKHDDFLCFETLKCPAIVLKFTKNFVLKFHYFLLGPLQISLSSFYLCLCVYALHVTIDQCPEGYEILHRS